MAGFKIPAVVKAAASKAFAQSPLGQAMRQAQNARRLLGVVSSSTDQSVIRQLGQATGAGDMRGLVRALQQSDPNAAWAWVERYSAQGSSEHALLRELLASLGPIGRVMSALLPAKAPPGTSGYGALGENLSQALNMLSAFSDQPEVLDSLERILTGAGAVVAWPNGRPVRAQSPSGRAAPPAPGTPKSGRTAPKRGGDEEAESLGGVVQGINTAATTVAVSDGGNIHALPPNHPALTGEWVETPASSNVYAFSYDLDAHRLYVRFKDRAQKGEKQRPNAPGPIYAYYNAPLDLFMAMFNAPSKGIWIWDNLRIRGTISGHRYDYSLVGVANGYVPRKATMTPEGESYIGRTVFSDKGRQLRSSRPDQLVRPLMGRMPNTGRNGLGG